MASTRFFIFFSLILVSSLVVAPSAASSASKVSVDLYYESLCPYSAKFIVDYLAKLFDNGLISIVDLKLFPYGNARIRSNGTITCQHGPKECLLNTVEACAISIWPDLNEHFSFIYCVEHLVTKRKYTEWESCFQETGLDSDAVLDCYENGNGEKLELQYAEQTDSLQPPHTYVPWVVVNGQPIYEDYEDVEAYICKAYEGELPKACEELPLLVTPEAKANRVHRISRVHKIIAPLQPAQKHDF